MFKKLKYVASGAAVLLTVVFAGVQVSAEEQIITETVNLLQDGGLYETSYSVQLPLPLIRRPSSFTTVSAAGSMGIMTILDSPASSEIRRKPQRMGLVGASEEASSWMYSWITSSVARPWFSAVT